MQRSLQQSREAVLGALDGLGEHDIRRPVTSSGTNLLGLVKHLAGIELGYLGDCVARPSPVVLPWDEDGSVWEGGDMWATAEESREYLVDLYRLAWSHSDESIRSLGLDAPASVAWWPEERRETTLGTLLVRVVAETARHAGHADVVREFIDGRGGSDHDDMGDEAWWAAYRATIQRAADAHRVAAAPIAPTRTARLVIRPAVAEDADAVWGYRSQPEVGRWLHGLPTDQDDYRSRFGTPDHLAATLIVERDGDVIGDLYVAISDGWAQREVADAAVRTQAEIGWVLDPAFHGHGYATEAVGELLRVAFEDLGVRRVVALCFADNDASWRLMERLGMRREAHGVEDSLHRSGAWLDGFTYALLASEWRSQQL